MYSVPWEMEMYTDPLESCCYSQSLVTVAEIFNNDEAYITFIVPTV